MTDPARLSQLRVIYEDAFDPAQREPWDLVVARIASGVSTMHGAWAGQQAVGFALAHQLPISRCLYVSHLAVAPAWRGRGVAWTMAALGQQFIASMGPGGLVLEIDDPDRCGDPQVAAHARRLQVLYERWGAHVICSSGYQMPDLRDPQVLLPMRLLWIAGQREAGAVRGPVLVDLVAELWSLIYGAPRTDPRVVRVLQAVARAG